jgi:hypothetical protein
MTNERWEELVKQMADLKLIDPAKVKASDCFDNTFYK